MNVDIYSKIEKGINSGTELVFTIKHGLGDKIENTVFQGYILGSDTYQYSFVWGYLPEFNLYYKFMLENILDVTNTQIKYSLREDACYLYAIEEEHYGIVKNFENIYTHSAK